MTAGRCSRFRGAWHTRSGRNRREATRGTKDERGKDGLKMSYFDQGSEQKKLGVLNTFCMNALRVKDDWLYIFGSLISMRKALELMDIDVVKNRTVQRAGWAQRPIDGIRETRKTAHFGERSFFEVDSPTGDSYFRFHTDLLQMERAVSGCLHYRGYECLEVPEAIWREEVRDSECRQLTNAFAQYANILPQFRELVSRYMRLAVGPNVELIAALEGDDNYSVDLDTTQIWEQSCKKLAMLNGMEADIYHPLLRFCTEVFVKYAERCESLIAMDSVYLCNRILAECYCVDQLRIYDREALNGTEMPTLNDYIGKLDNLQRNVGNETQEDAQGGGKWSSYTKRLSCTRQIGEYTNRLAHVAGDSADEEKLNYSDKEEFKAYTRVLNVLGRSLLKSMILGMLPSSMEEWINKDEGLNEKLEEKLTKALGERDQWIDNYEKANDRLTQTINEYTSERIQSQKKIKRLRIACCILGSIVGIVVVVGIVAYLTSFSHPGDPSPALTDEAVVATDWDEIPAVSASIDGVALQPGVPQAFAYTGSAPNLLISASDAGENSLKWAGNSRFMKLKDAAVNDAGIVMLECRFVTVDASGSEINAASIPLTNNSVWTMRGQAPGRYILRVQAVGAADGLKQGGKELNAATGWIEYPIVLLPESADWTLRNDNSGDVVAKSESLDTYVGDVMFADFDSAIDGAILRARWDAGEEWTAMEDGKFRVPGDLAPGNHVLHLSAAYEFMGREIDANCGEDFSLIVQQAAPVEPESERRIQIHLWDQDGTTLEDGSTWIASPGDTLYFEGYAPNGIESWNFTQIDENGEKREWTRPGTDKNVNLGGSYGQPSFTITLEAVEKGGAAAGRSSVSLRVLCRTKEDEEDEIENTTKEWVYGDPTSNEPTGYIFRKYDEEDREIEMSYWDADGKPVYGDQGHYHRRTTKYDGDSWSQFIYDLDGVTLIDGDPEVFDGAAGIANIYDTKNNTYELQHLGTDGKLKCTNAGEAGFTLYYDARGNVTCEVAFGENKEPVLRESGYSYYKSDYDERNRETDKWYYGTDGKTPVLWNNRYQHVHYRYDDYDNVEMEEFFGVDGKPCIDPNVGYARAEYTFDADGHRTSAIYYDLEGVIYQDGYAKWVRTYEPGTDNENELSCAYQDADGRAVTNSRYGYAYCDSRYEKWYRDEQGRPVVCSDGFARWEHKREALDGGMLETSAFYDAEGQLVVPKDQDWALAESEYDARGNCIVHRYKGVDGKLTGTSELSGAAYVEYRYDGDEMTREFYYSADGTPHLMGSDSNVNYYGRSYAKDAQDNHVSYVRYLDANGQPIENELGAYMAKITYDDHGNAVLEERFTRDNTYLSGDAVSVVAWTYFDGTDFDGTDKVSSKRETSEQSSTEWVYDEEGHEISTSYYDANGGNRADDYDVWKYTWGYVQEEDGPTIVTEACYGVDGELVIGPEGFAKLEMEYDTYSTQEDVLDPWQFDIYKSKYEGNYGKTYEERHYGADGNLIVNDQVGYAVLHREATMSSYTQEFYDARGEEMENPNAGYARFEQMTSTQENGHSMIVTAYYDAQGALMIGPKGFAKYEQESDESENVGELYPYIWLDDIGNGPFYEERYYGADGEPMLYEDIQGMGGFAVYHRETTATQNVFEYRDAAGNLIGYGPNKIARIVKKYADGEMISKAYFGADGLPILNEYGFAEECWTYDEDGELMEHKFLNVDGKPMLNEYGTYAIETWTREDGRMPHSYLDEDGELRVNPDVGYAEVVKELSDAEVRTHYLDADGKDVIVEMYGFGYAERVARRIEEDGKQGLEITFLDANGEVIVPPELGFSRVVQFEVEQGREFEQHFYNGDDPVQVDSFPVFTEEYILSE